MEEEAEDEVVEAVKDLDTSETERKNERDSARREGEVAVVEEEVED